MGEDKYRLVTRTDFDGVVAGGLLIELDMVDQDDVRFAEPRDVQQAASISRPAISQPTCLMWTGCIFSFGHHVSETVRVGEHKNHIIDPNAPSAARVVYEYYGGENAFLKISTEMMDAVD